MALRQTKLSRKDGNRDHLLRNLATSVILYEHIDTSVAKAKVTKSLVDRWITFGKRGTLAHRRALLAQTFEPLAADKIFDVLAKRYQNRAGGYTRITQLGKRLGDGAEIVRLELVDREVLPSATAVIETEKSADATAVKKARTATKKPVAPKG